MLFVLLALFPVSLAFWLCNVVPKRFRQTIQPFLTSSIGFAMLKARLHWWAALRSLGIAASAPRGHSQDLCISEHSKLSFAQQIELSLLQGGLTNDFSNLLRLWSSPQLIETLEIRQFQALKKKSIGDLCRHGQFSAAFNLNRALTRALDVRCLRPNGLRNETAHFSAVGHLALFHYLLVGVEQGRIDPNKLDFRRVRQSGNPTYAAWLAERACSLGVSVSSEAVTEEEAEPNLDIWPTDNDYEIAWYHHAEVLTALAAQPQKSRLVECEFISLGLEYLSSRGWKAEKPTVGFHIQNALHPSRDARNSDPKKYHLAMSRLLAEGYNVVVLSPHLRSVERANPEGAIYLDRSSAQQVVDSVNLAVWQLSRFFVGNQSGGTHPPGAFLTPTLWIDRFPIISSRSQGERDIYIPQILIDRRSKTPLPLGMAMDPSMSFLQIENTAELKAFGFKLRGATAEEIDAAVREMQLSWDRSSGGKLSETQIYVARQYANLGFTKGGHISASFASKWQGWVCDAK